MTKATDKPLARVVQTKYSGDLVVEVTSTKVTLRPVRTRRGGAAEVVLSWGSIYERALAARAS